MADLLAARDGRSLANPRRLLGCGVSALALTLSSAAYAQTQDSGQVQQPTAPTANTQDGAISTSTDVDQAGAPAPDVSQGQAVTEPDATDTAGDDIVITGIRSSL
ncbi:hypothetical protein, partial [Raoultella terrigena]|uniref:hypothetical protein n=1 Tax=Raoultella terrigena TaxID=577 RepID=UPI00133057AB